MNCHLPRRQLCLAVAAAFTAALPLGPQCLVSQAHANPSAPIVNNGSASFHTQGKTLTVTNTPGAIINWQSFSISAGETAALRVLGCAS